MPIKIDATKGYEKMGKPYHMDASDMKEFIEEKVKNNVCTTFDRNAVGQIDHRKYLSSYTKNDVSEKNNRPTYLYVKPGSNGAGGHNYARVYNFKLGGETIEGKMCQMEINGRMTDGVIRDYNRICKGEFITYDGVYLLDNDPEKDVGPIDTGYFYMTGLLTQSPSYAVILDNTGNVTNEIYTGGETVVEDKNTDT